MKKLLLFIPLLLINCSNTEDLESHDHDWDYADDSHTQYSYDIY